jgi:4-hydroxybenzoate polyprenyltransferase
VLPPLSKVWLLVWLLLSIGYSVPPLRFKARPLIDAYSNILYALPGLVLYSLFVAQLPPWWLVVSLLCWNAAMHTLSALPDIVADTKAGLRTTAVVLGRKKASWFVLLNWVVAVSLPLLLMTSVPWWTLVPLLVYPFVGYCALKSDETALFALYQKMPLLNAIIGLYLFWLVLLSRFGLDALWQVLQ